jgi:exosortase/archaeosortase family protein
VGLLYVYLAAHRSRVRNGLLLASILPIAFTANVVRVLVLVLLTYYAGEAAGRSFHDHAGLLEVLLAFASFLAFDRLLGWIGRLRWPPSHRVANAGFTL